MLVERILDGLNEHREAQAIAGRELVAYAKGRMGEYGDLFSTRAEGETAL